MTIVIKQLHKCSRIQSNEHQDNIRTATLYFRVTGTQNEVSALEAMRQDTTTVPTTFNGCALDSFSVVDWLGVNGFEIEALYKRSSGNGISSSASLPPETEEFHGSLQGIHIAYSKAFREKDYGESSETTVNRGHQIEPLEDGVNAVGCDTYTAVGQLIIRHYFRTLSRSDEIAIENLLNHVNDDTFRGRAAGTLLFSAFDVTPIGTGNDAYVECVYTFSYMPNGTATFKGDNGDISITKKGWEYAWAKYFVNDQGTGGVTREVQYACAEVVFDSATFSSSTLKISAS